MPKRRPVSKASASKTKPAAPDESAKKTSAPPDESEQGRNESFPIVGIGASAGGLEAFRQLLEHLPTDTGMAFILVQHLDPTHGSILAELLSRNTRIPVSEVRDGITVESDHIYVIPPNSNMSIVKGILRLLPREEARKLHRPIDFFMHTLAEDQGHRAIGVILSGTAFDGTLGLEAIKAEGGITFAQDPQLAKYDSMPRSAIDAGHVDFILSPKDIAQELARISRHPYVAPPATTPVKEAQSTGQNGFRKILALLRKAKAVDFTDYKTNTLHRRIARRMVLNKLESMEDYARFLRENVVEMEALYQDILINVTSFFRDPEAFRVLKEKIFPHIVKHRAPDEPIRIWTLGCSTGEEAYSIAISFAEFTGDQPEHIPVQIFATDLNDRGIDKARAGLYSKEIAEDVSPGRLRRFFTEAEGGYLVSKPIRDMVVFARQNALADPPFSRLDLISCRNLLIYLEPVLQKQVLPTLHYALKPTGILWLGSSETVGSASELFTLEDKKHRFYSKKPVPARLSFKSVIGSEGHQEASIGQQTNYMSMRFRTEHDAQKEADRILLSRYSPASVLINADMEILHFRGSTGAYLESPPGTATFNLLKMAREGLMLPLRSAIQKAKKDNVTVKKEGVRVSYDGTFRTVNLEVIPIKGIATNERCFLVVFEPVPERNLGQETKSLEAKASQPKRKIGQASGVARLQEELAATREYMQSLVEQHEAANEELQSANEEVQSSNEELQSINEELETAKEELESSNEELATLNDELQNRNLELSVLNDDLKNLLGSVDIPILMLGSDLRIRRFTPQAERVLSLIATDVGRPISDIKLKINLPDLEELIAEVISTVSVKEREVQDRQGRWYSMRVRPYRTQDNKIDGAVVVLIDINDLKNYSQAMVETIREPLIVLDENLRVRTANRSFYETFKASPEETQNQFIYDLGNRQWDIPRLRTLLEEILPQNSQFQDLEVEHKFESIGPRTMLLNARRLQQESSRAPLILLAIEDITERKQTKALRESEDRFRTLFSSVPVAVFVCGHNAVIQGYNRRAVELWGQEPDAGIEHCDSIKLFLPDGTPLPDSQNPIVEVLRSGISVNNVELMIERPDGSRISAIVNVAALRDAQEEIVGAVIAFEDITELKRTQEAVRESAERFRFMAESMPQKIFTARPNGEVDYFNQQWMEFMGLSFEQIKNWSWTQFIHPDDVDENIRQWQRSIDTGEPFQIEHRFRRADGKYRWHLSRAHAMCDAKGKVLIWIASSTDIDDMKRAEEERNHLLAREQAARAEAEEANRIKDEFLATVSHELRTPLNAMLGWVQILRSGELNEAEVTQALEAIERNTKAQSQLVADLLDTSRISMDKLHFEWSPVELIPVIEAALETVRPTAEAKGVELRAELDPAAGPVLGDAARLQQIVWNLLANAIKYTPQGGHVETRLEREGSSVAITVRDTGEGIGPEFLPHVFVPFRQADGATTRRHGGLGIGLAIVRHLVDAHGGQVSASSEGAGQGTTFRVVLPLTTLADSDSMGEDKDEAEQSTLLTGLRVLLVDDNLDARVLFSTALKKCGAEVRVGATVREALEILGQWQPDVLVSDIGMPDEDGYDLIRQVRSLPDDRGGQIPAVAVTGFTSTKDAASALAAGYQMFVTKPIDLRGLVAIIKSLTQHFGTDQNS